MDNIIGYKILKELGKGGMARVYLAQEEGLDRLVALKVLRAEIDEQDAEEFAKRFLREAKMASSLSHPNIVPIYAMRSDEGKCFIAMEFLSGGDLKSHITEGLTVEKSLKTIERILDALKYAHAKGITHRDIKPDNIVFREQGDPVLTDFGIAKVQGGGTKITKTNVVLGTPSYMSPEQFETSNVTTASDIYSLGVVLFEMLAGACPYAADSMATAMKKHLMNPIPELPSRLSEIQNLMNKMLAKSADSRFTAEEAQQEIQKILSKLPEDILDSLPEQTISMSETVSMKTDPSLATERFFTGGEVKKGSHIKTIMLGLLGGLLIGVGVSYFFINKMVSESIAPSASVETPEAGEVVSAPDIVPVKVEKPVEKASTESQPVVTEKAVAKVEAKPVEKVAVPEPKPEPKAEPEPTVKASPPPPKETVLSPAQKLRKHLDSLEGLDMRLAMKEYYKTGEFSREEMDVFAQKLWEQKDNPDEQYADGMAHVCKIIIKREDFRYKALLEKLSTEASQPKIQRYAQSVLGDLQKLEIVNGPQSVEQFIPR